MTRLITGFSLMAALALAPFAQAQDAAPMSEATKSEPRVIDGPQEQFVYEQSIGVAGGQNAYARFKGPGTGGAVDEETAKLMKEERQLAEKIAQISTTYKGLSEGEARSKAEAELQKLVAEQFGVRQSLRERQLAALEDRIKQLRELHAKRIEQRDRIVNDRVQQLLRDAAGLGWGDMSGSDGGGPLKMKTDSAAVSWPLTTTRQNIIRKVKDGDSGNSDITPATGEGSDLERPRK